MRKNVGTIDATVRITLGLLGLAYGIGKMSRRPYRAPWLLMSLSAMKIAEGFTRFCPMLYAMGVNTRKENGMENMWGQTKKITETNRNPEQPLSRSDQQLENQIKDYVVGQETETSKKEYRQSDAYSMDERIYPTYS
jgi:hypothetical protein